MRLYINIWRLKAQKFKIYPKICRFLANHRYTTDYTKSKSVGLNQSKKNIIKIWHILNISKILKILQKYTIAYQYILVNTNI